MNKNAIIKIRNGNERHVNSVVSNRLHRRPLAADLCYDSLLESAFQHKNARLMRGTVERRSVANELLHTNEPREFIGQYYAAFSRLLRRRRPPAPNTRNGEKIVENTLSIARKRGRSRAAFFSSSPLVSETQIDIPPPRAICGEREAFASRCGI